MPTSTLPLTKFDDSMCRRWGWLTLLAVTLLLYLPGLSTLPMMDRDEPRFAHATVEMMQRGTWTVPYFNGEYRFDKPPLTYWWMRLHYAVAGVNELAARLHTLLSTWLIAVVIASIGRRLLSAQAGLVAGLAWLVTLQVQVHGRLCVADMPMVLCVTVALRAMLEVLLQAEALRQDAARSHALPAFGAWHWLLYVALGLGFLAKGPIAWIIPALALLLKRLLWRRAGWELRALHAGKGMALALAIVALWGIPALCQTQGLFWVHGIGEHVVARGTSALNGRFPVPGYYLATAIASLFPWIALLPQVWSRLRQVWSQPVALLVAWFAAPYVVFSLYATQLPHYVMPGFPAAMVLLAFAWPGTKTLQDKRLQALAESGPASEAHPQPPAAPQPGERRSWWSIGVFAVFAVLAVALGYVAQLPHLPVGLHPVAVHVAAVVGLWLGLGIASCRLYREQTAAAWSVAVLLAVGLATAYALVASDIRSVHPAAQMRTLIGPVPEQARLLGWRFSEPSLVFHFDHPWRFTNKRETLEKALAKPPAQAGELHVITVRREWRLLELLRAQPASTDYSQEIAALLAKHPHLRVQHLSGFNAARSSWVELTALSLTSVVSAK